MKRAGLIITAIGLLLHAYIAFFKSENGASSFSMGLMVWSWLPYIVSFVLFLVVRRSLIPLCGVIPLLIMDTIIYYSVFIKPESSTAALGLLWMPLWNLVLFMPVGLFVGWILSIFMKNKKEKLQQSHPPDGLRRR